jgi:S1-C subfamily serine protease
MKKAVINLKAILLGILTGSIVAFHLFYIPPVKQDFHSIKNLSNSYTINEKKAIARSTESSVQVFSLGDDLLSLSALSGTYFTYNNKFYVLTSAHGIIGKCVNVKVSYLESQVNCLEIKHIDNKADYAVFEVSEIPSRKAIKIEQVTANPKKSFNILDKVYYTGYPNSTGPTTWTGTIAGVGADYLIMQSYAWSGASGSGVFDEKGSLIGIIMALDVGRTKEGVQILNNFVIIVPTWAIDWEQVFKE